MGTCSLNDKETKMILFSIIKLIILLNKHSEAFDCVVEEKTDLVNCSSIVDAELLYNATFPDWMRLLDVTGLELAPKFFNKLSKNIDRIYASNNQLQNLSSI